MQQYLLVTSNEAYLTCCTRVGANVWKMADYTGLTMGVLLPALGLDLHLAEVYCKVPLPTAI